MECIHLELKYCEGCGTLKLRPINSVTEHCVVCDRMLARFRFPRKLAARKLAGFRVVAVRRQIAPAVCGTVPRGRTA